MYDRSRVPYNQGQPSDPLSVILYILLLPFRIIGEFIQNLPPPPSFPRPTSQLPGATSQYISEIGEGESRATSYQPLSTTYKVGIDMVPYKPPLTTYENIEEIEFPNGFDPDTFMPRKIVIHRKAESR